MPEEDSTVVVARGASYLILQNMFNTVIGVIALSVITRTIPETEIGVMAVLTLVVGVCQLVSGMGFPKMATKFIADFMGRERRDGAAGVGYGTLRVSLIISSLMSLLVFHFSDDLSLFTLKSTVFGGIFKVLAIDLVFATPLPSLTAIIVGLQKIREASMINIIRGFVKQVSVVSLVLFGFGLRGIVIGWILADLVNFTLFLGLIIKNFGLSNHSFDLKRLTFLSLPVLASDSITFIYSWFDRVLLLTFLPLKDLGVYNMAFTAYLVLNSIPVAIYTALYPKYSELHGRGGVQDVEKAISKASRYVSFIVVPLCLGLMVTATPTISLFAGPKYAGGGYPLAVLSGFTAIESIGSVIGSVLLVFEETRMYAVITAISVLTGILSGTQILPSFGMTGAALSRGVAAVVSLLLTFLVIRRKMRLSFDNEALWKSWVASLLMVIVVGVVEYICFSKYLLFAYVLIGGSTYLLTLRILHAANKDDFLLIRKFMGDRWRWVVDLLARLLAF